MLKLEKHITLSKATIESPNLTDRFDDIDLQRIGNYVYEGFSRDDLSRDRWMRRTSAAMDLAMQILKPKSFPWDNCSNIAFPLITIATMQFHSVAYPATVQGTNVVKCRVLGDDPTGQKRARSERISAHMSYQVLEEDKAWEEQHDRLLINLPIVGCAFKKSYYSASQRHNVSELVLAKDLVLDYYATSLEACARKTHVVPLFRNEIYERVRRGTFRDILEAGWYKENAVPTQDTAAANTDTRTGLTPQLPDRETPFETLEQHCGLDLDGDGYSEPYIVTIERNSRQVLRIVTRFDRMEDIEKTSDGKIITIRPMEYFTKYSFIPAPDGGIYDMGFGVLLGPLNESVNSLINQLTDAGTMATTAGGFLGRGAKVRGGVYSFSPLEWKRVDATGDDLKKSIFPLPVREPSQVLYNLLSLLINYTNRVYGGTDVMVGENPGQNTPAETSRNMTQQGMKVYNVIFKRVWRSMKEEFKKLYVLNGIYMDSKKQFGSGGGFALREDYLGDPESVSPAADPHLVSDGTRYQQALAIAERSRMAPGYDIEAVERNFLKAMHVDGIDTFYPGPQKVPPLPNPKMQVEQVKLQGKQMQYQHEQAMFAAELMEERRLNTARILKLKADAVAALEGVSAEKARLQIETFDATIGALEAHDESLRKRIELVMKGLEHGGQASDGAGVPGMAEPSGDKGVPPSPFGMEGRPQGAMG